MSSIWKRPSSAWRTPFFKGHRSALIHGAFRAAFIEGNYAQAFYLYALFEGSEPDIAEQRWAFADQLTQAEIDEAEQAAAIWRAENVIKDHADFMPETNSESSE